MAYISAFLGWACNTKGCNNDKIENKRQCSVYHRYADLEELSAIGAYSPWVFTHETATANNLLTSSAKLKKKEEGDGCHR